ncbi:MAG TPA: CBS domain-containing protein [bacterium]|nr:CBS domain-containing protein [bacterium]
MEAREIMSKDVVAVAPEMLVTEAADLLLRYRIHRAPVVDEADQMVGMVSFMDLAARRGKTVRDVMAPDPVWASEDTPVDEVAAMMLDQMVRRVPIVRGGRVVGVVSASDIIQVFLNLHEVPISRKDLEVSRGKAGRR